MRIKANGCLSIYANFCSSSRSKLDSCLGIPIGGMRIPTLDDDHGLSSLSGRYLNTLPAHTNIHIHIEERATRTRNEDYDEYELIWEDWIGWSGLD